MRHGVFQPVLDCAAPLPLTKPHQQLIFHYNHFFFSFFFLKCALLSRQISNANPNLSVICRLNTTRSVIKGVFESLLKQFRSYSQGVGRGCLCRCFFYFVFFTTSRPLRMCKGHILFNTDDCIWQNMLFHVALKQRHKLGSQCQLYLLNYRDDNGTKKHFCQCIFFFFYCPISFFCSAKIVQGTAVCSVKQHFSVTLIRESPLRAAPLAFFKLSAVLYQ